MTHTVLLTLCPNLPFEQLHEDDKELPGRYVVTLPASVPVAHLRHAATDIFHAHYGVSVLDDFDFQWAGRDGRPLPHSPGKLDDGMYEDIGDIEAL